jgi:large subunit ribosomal protein L25
MNKVTFTLQTRNTLGKGVSALRKQRQVPVNVVVPHHESLATVAESQALINLYAQVGDTGLVYLKVGEEKTTRPALIEDMQVNPVTGELLHLVFKQVNLKEKIKANVPVELVGENSVPDTNVVAVVDEIEVEALPTDLPEKFEINVETLTEIGQMVTFQDLEYDKSLVTLTISEEELTQPVVMLQAQAVEEPEAEAAESTDGSEAQAEGGAETNTQAAETEKAE